MGDYRTTKLEVELLFRAKPEMVTEGLEVAFEVGYWMSVGIGIVDAKASSYIYSLELDPSFSPFVLDTVYGLAKHQERFDLGDL